MNLANSDDEQERENDLWTQKRGNQAAISSSLPTQLQQITALDLLDNLKYNGGKGQQ